VTIKDKVEKLIKVGFIYPMQIMEWVSNTVPVNKKHGVIHVCMEFHDMEKSYLKVNFPIPFIDQIVDGCVGCEIFSFMDDFFESTKFKSNQRINIKWHLYVLGVHSHTGKFIFSLRILEPLFSGPCHSPSTTSRI
jgi:hypothetical protein